MTIYGSTFPGSRYPYDEVKKPDPPSPTPKKESITGKKSTKLTRRQKRMLTEIFEKDNGWDLL